MDPIQKRLIALSYSRRAEFRVTDPREFVALVGFLEHRIVRHYDVKQREGLLQVGEMFDAAFGTYLKELGCPVPAGRREEQLMWLLNYAVAMRFEDDAAGINAGAKAPGADISELRSAVAAAAAAAGMPAPPVAPVALQQLDAQLQGVASALRSKRALLAAGGVGSRAGVAEAARHAGAAAGGAGSAGSGGARRQRGASALAAAGAQPPSAEASLGEHLKPGFTSGDADVDRAATLLRVLYLEDLRQLQTQVNSLIEQAQEFTANPKTNTALGKVGH